MTRVFAEAAAALTNRGYQKNSRNGNITDNTQRLLFSFAVGGILLKINTKAIAFHALWVGYLFKT